MWYSISELLSLGSPELPQTCQAIKRKANREAWEPKRKRNNRGGGWEYHLSALPPKIRESLGGEIVESSPPAAPRTSSADVDPDFIIEHPPNSPRTNVRNYAQSKAAAIAFILEELLPFCEENSLLKCHCRMLFASAYNKGLISIPEWVREAVPTVSDRNLQRWEKTSIEELAVNRYGKRKGQDKVGQNPEIVELIQTKVAAGWTVPHIYELLKLDFEVNFSSRTLARWIDNWKSKNPSVAAIIEHPEKARSAYGSGIGSQSQNLTHPNQEWALDSTLVDSKVIEFSLKEGATWKRFYLVAGIDLYSCRCRFYVTPTSNAEAIIALIRQMMLDFGVPEAIRTDNGKDYISKRLQIAIAPLNCRHIKCLPRTPKQKARVERLFGVLCDDLISRLPGFLGRNVEERQAIRSKNRLIGNTDEKLLGQFLLDRHEFQQRLDQWCDWYESQRIHSDLSMTPIAKWHEGVMAKAPTSVEERQLDLLLAPAAKAQYGLGLRKVTQGKVIISDYEYVSAALMRSDINGTLVHVRYDLCNIGRVVVYRDESLSEFLCVAECKQLMGQKELIAEAKAGNKEFAKAEREVKALLQKAADTSGDIERIQDDRLTNSKVIPLFGKRQATKSFESQSLREAQEALSELDAQQELTLPAIAPVPPAQSEKTAAPIVRDDDYFLKLWRQLEADKAIETEDANWMRLYMSLWQGQTLLEIEELSEAQILHKLNQLNGSSREAL